MKNERRKERGISTTREVRFFWLSVGEVIIRNGERRRWHGVAKDSWFVHLAVEAPSEGGSNEWLEPEDDEQYGKLDQ